MSCNILLLRVDFVRSVRVDAQDSQLRRTHESAVKASSPTPAPLPLLIVSAPPNPFSRSRLDEPAWSELTQRRKIDPFFLFGIHILSPKKHPRLSSKARVPHSD